MSFHGDLLKDPKRLLQLFHNSSRVRSLRAIKILHAISFTVGAIPNQTLFVQNNVLFLYASVGKLPFARELFDQMPQRNVVSYNTLIGAYSKLGCVEQAWNMFSEMRRVCGFNPTEFTFGGLMSCESLDVRRGVQLQACVVKNGLFVSNVFVGTSLFGLYGRLGLIDEAVCTFEDMPCKSPVTWNSMLSLLSRRGFIESCVFLFRELVRTRVSLSECSVSSILSGFSYQEDLNFGEHIHGFSVKLGFGCEISVANSLINMYVKCVTVDLAEKIFDEMTVRDVVTWNTMIGAVAKSSNPERAYEHVLAMSFSGVFPNGTTYVNLISCCTSMGHSLHGEKFHAQTIINGLESDVCVGTALVYFYSRCDKLESARTCFNEIYSHNAVSWNALISGYSKKCSKTSTTLLRGMLRSGHEPNEYTFSVVLKSLSTRELSQVHCLAIRMGYQDNRFVLSSLITSYSKNGLIANALAFVTASDSPLLTVPSNISAGIFNRTGQHDEALKLLSHLDEPDRVSWNIVIEACARNDCHGDVFELLNQMNLNGICPDNFTLVTLLSISAARLSLALGSSIHALIIKTNFDRCDSIVCNVLVDMYRKCGSISSAARVFGEAEGRRNLVMWTTLISALGLSGRSREALERFGEMESAGIEPDNVAFSAVLMACRHGGLVAEGMKLFRRMKTCYRLEPEIQHYQNIVDLLAKNGQATEIERVISEMPYPRTAIIWHLGPTHVRPRRQLHKPSFIYSA